MLAEQHRLIGRRSPIRSVRSGTIALVYQELAPPVELRPFVTCLWSRQAVVDGPPIRVMPDGCVDLVFDDAGELSVAGPDTRSWDSSPAGHVAAIRLRPGAAGGVLGLPAAELRNQRARLAELWGDDAARLEERLRRAVSTDDRFRLLESAVASRGSKVDPLVVTAASRFGPQEAPVRELADAVGLSRRQLLRRFQKGVGYGPKMLQRVARIRAFTSFVSATPGQIDLARAAADFGFSDQAHLTHECRALVGVTPAAFMSQIIKTGG